MKIQRPRSRYVRQIIAAGTVLIVSLLILACGPSQAEKDFYGSLRRNSDQARQDLSQAISLMEKVSEGQDIKKEETGVLLAQLTAVKQTLRQDAAGETLPAPAECADCQSKDEALKQSWLDIIDAVEQNENELRFLFALQEVHETELADLKGLPVMSYGVMMSDRETIDRFDGQRQVYEKTLTGFIALRPQATNDRTKKRLEDLISSEQGVIDELTNLISLIPYHQVTLINDSSLKLSGMSAKNSMAWRQMEGECKPTLHFSSGLLLSERESLDSFISGLLQAE